MVIPGSAAPSVERRSTLDGRKFHRILLSPPTRWNCSATSATQDRCEAFAKAGRATRASAETETLRFGHDIDAQRLIDGSVVKHHCRRVASDGHEPTRKYVRNIPLACPCRKDQPCWSGLTPPARRVRRIRKASRPVAFGGSGFSGQLRTGSCADAGIGEDVIEGGGEVGAAVADQEVHRGRGVVEVHEHVSGHLCGPLAGRMEGRILAGQA
jgi:hypothetical protein